MNGTGGTKDWYRERSLRDTGRPPGVLSLAPAQGAPQAWTDFSPILVGTTMDKQFSNKQTGYWGAVNTNNSSTSSDGAKLTPEQWAAMSMYYAAQKKVAETFAMYYGATTTSADDRQKQNISEGYSTSAHGKSATTNRYDRTSNQKTTSGFNTSTYNRTQDVSQQKPSKGYNTANQQTTNKLYGETKMNMKDSLGTSYGATEGYGNLGMSYGAGSSTKFPESSITGTLSMSYESSMRAFGSSKVFEGTTQSSGNNEMSWEGAKGPGRLNVPHGTEKYDSEGANITYGEIKSLGGPIKSPSMPFGATKSFRSPAQPSGTLYGPRSNAVASEGRSYGTNRQNPLGVDDLMDDSEHGNDRMPKTHAKMGFRRLSREQDEFSGSPERYVGKGAYMRNKAPVRTNRSWDELQLEREESRSPWKKTDSSYNREQWKYQDSKSTDTVSSNRRSSPHAFGKEAPGPPRRKRDASFDRGAWHQKDDLRKPFESEESGLSWNKSGPSYLYEESELSSKNRGLYGRNENGRSFDRETWSKPGDFHDREERAGRPWERQAMEEERTPPLKGQDMEENSMPPWKKRVMEREMLKQRAMEEMFLQQKRQMRESLSSGIGDLGGSLPPWKRRIMGEIEERVPPWNREREQELEERVPPSKYQRIGETIPTWKRQDEERLRFSPPKGNRDDESLSRRQNEQVISRPTRPRGLDVPSPSKLKGRNLPKKQKGKAFKKRLRDRNQKFTKRKGRKKADSDSDEDPTPVVPAGIAVMICYKGYPVVGLTKNQSNIIMDCLLKAMENLADNESPQFSTPNFMMSGILSIICANEHSCAWLKKKVEALKVPWKEADLTVRPFRVPMIIYIPGAEEPEDEVREALQKANPYFRVREWELLKKDILKVRVEYAYLIDFISFEALKVIQFRPYYKNTRVLVKMVHSPLKTAEGSKEAVNNGKKGDAELTETEILLKEATQTDEKVETNRDRDESTEVELSETEILLRQIEQGEK